MAKQKAFNKIWKNQTEIGLIFGMRPISVGKKLIELGLKDKSGATQKALDEGFAKFTPLADKTPFFMWNVEKVTEVFDHAGVERKSPVKAYAAKIIPGIRSCYEHPFLCDLTWDSLTDAICEVPPQYRKEVRDLVEIAVFGQVSQPSKSELKERERREKERDKTNF